MHSVITDFWGGGRGRGTQMAVISLDCTNVMFSRSCCITTSNFIMINGKMCKKINPVDFGFSRPFDSQPRWRPLKALYHISGVWLKSWCVGSSLRLEHRLVGLVVKASTSIAADLGFESCLCWDFSRSSHTSDSTDLKISTPVATLPGTWCYRVSAGTGWPGVSILWLEERLPCQAPGVIGSVLGLVGLVSVYCDWRSQQILMCNFCCQCGSTYICLSRSVPEIL